MGDLISVIVPVYNGEEHLERCITSILKSSHQNIELLLVNDGSTDNSRAICEKYKNIDKRVILINKENGGQASARNIGLDYATGDYITFVDDDDEIEPEMYMELISELEKNKVQISGCATMMIYSDGQCKNRFTQLESGIMDTEYFILNILHQNAHSWGTVWNKLFVKELKKELYFPNGSELEDYWVMLRILYKVKKVFFLSKPYYKWYQSESSQSKRAFHEQLLTGLMISKDIHDFFVKNNADEIIIKACKYFDFCVRFGIIEAMWKTRDRSVYKRIKPYVIESFMCIPSLILDKNYGIQALKRYAKVIIIAIKTCMYW